MLAAKQIVINKKKRLITQGRKEGIIITHLNMFKKKIDINIIEKVTGLKEN